tara:strand:- start:22531 stop:22800 length:270 start_codon:yes stop_codon:yes gene_type:complete
MKPYNPRNGFIKIRTRFSTLNEYKAVTKQNAQQKVMDCMLMLMNKGIEWGYVVAYPKDGNAFLAVHKKFGNDWQQKGFFPELFQQTEEA